MEVQRLDDIMLMFGKWVKFIICTKIYITILFNLFKYTYIFNFLIIIIYNTIFLILHYITIIIIYIYLYIQTNFIHLMQNYPQTNTTPGGYPPQQGYNDPRYGQQSQGYPLYNP